MPNLFPRHCRLILADEGGEGVDLGRLSMKFEVSRSTITPAPGFAKLTIINLSPQTIAKIEKKYTRIELEAGYAQRFGTIFKGDVAFLYVTKDGPDRLVEIFANDQRRDVEDSYFNGTLLAGMSLREAVATVAATFSRTPVGSLETLTDQPLRSTLVASDMTVTVLEGLARDYGFRFVIDGGVAQFLDIGRPAGGPAILVSRETGMIESPQIQTSGIEFLSLLDPRLVPGRRIEVRTAGAQNVTSQESLRVAQPPAFFGQEFARGGRFDVFSLVHVGETRGQTWYTRAFCVREGQI